MYNLFTKEENNLLLKKIGQELSDKQTLTIQIINSFSILINEYQRNKEALKKLDDFIKSFSKYIDNDSLNILLERKRNWKDFLINLIELEYWMENHNKCVPNRKTEDVFEKKLATFLSYHTYDDKEVNKTKNEMVKRLVENKSNNLTIGQFEENKKYLLFKEKLLDFIHNNDFCIPYKRATDPEERDLGMKLANFTNSASKADPVKKAEILYIKENISNGMSLEGYNKIILNFETLQNNLKSWLEKNDNCLPSRASTDEEELKLATLLHNYTRETSSIDSEKKEIIRKILETSKGHTVLRDTFENNFKQFLEDLNKFIEKNNYKPSEKSVDLEEIQLAKNLRRYLSSDYSPEKREQVNSILDKLSVQATKLTLENISFFEERKKDLIKFLINNEGYLPSESKNSTPFERSLASYFHRYINENILLVGAKRIEEVKEIINKYSNGERRYIEKDINIILKELENIVINIANNKETTGLINSLKRIIEEYEYFTDKEKLRFEFKDKNIKEYLDSLLLRKDNIENIGIEEIQELQEVIFEEIKNNPTANGAYIASYLNNIIEVNQKDPKEREIIEEELYSINSIVKYLEFKDHNKQDKDIIVDGFKSFIDKIKILDAEGKEIELKEWHKIEIKSHFITFFEYFNPEDFKLLKETVKNKTKEEFFEIIINNINNSSLSIGIDKEKQKTTIFTKNSKNEWTYNAGGSGELDLFASYNKQIITASSTGGGNEGKQLLYHPIKADLLLKETIKVIEEEIKSYGLLTKNGFYSFDKKSIFEGLEIKIDKGEIELKYIDTPYLKDITIEKIAKMDNNFLLLKTLVESNINSKHKKKNRLIEIQEKLISKHSFLKKNSNLLKELGKNSINSKINKEMIKKVFEKTNYKHIFDVPNLTYKTLNIETNILYVSMIINDIKLNYTDLVEDIDDFIRSFNIRVPYVSNYSYLMAQKTNEVEKIGYAIFETFKDLSETEISGNNAETRLSEKFKTTYFSLFNSKEEYSFGEEIEDTNINPELFNKIFNSNNKQVFKSALISYLNTIQDKNERREKLSRLDSLSEYFGMKEQIENAKEFILENNKLLSKINLSEEETTITIFISFMIEDLLEDEKYQKLLNKNWQERRFEVYELIKNHPEFKKQKTKNKGEIFKNFENSFIEKKDLSKENSKNKISNNI